MNRAQKLVDRLGVPCFGVPDGMPKRSPSHTKSGPGRRHQQGKK